LKQLSDDDPTPLQGTGSGAYPLLQTGAEEKAAELLRHGGDAAMAIRRQLLAIAALFRSWSPENKPTDAERTQLVDELVEATKKAAVILSRR
jgi:hypothetical protein